MKTTATLGLNWTSSAWRRTRLTSSATGRHSKEATSPSAQRGAKSWGAAKVEGVQHVALERPARLVEAGVAPPPRRSYARGKIGGYPRLLGRLPPRLLEQHLARGHAPRGKAVEQPRPRRPGGGSPSHPHARWRAPVVRRTQGFPPIWGQNPFKKGENFNCSVICSIYLKREYRTYFYVP